jgi:SAM-dependent methyltransferase
VEQSYLKETINVYKDAAENPNVGLCCTTSPVWAFPGLDIPKKMLSMNYGCGTTVAPRDLTNSPTVLYIGIGGGMELLQFSYFSRKQKGVIGVDPVQEMITACKENFEEAAKSNKWFDPSFIDLRFGDALDLPIADETVDVVAQNCLFNIFKQEELTKALSEAYRVLKPHGRLVLSDPICEQVMPDFLKEDDHLRALCLSGAILLQKYLDTITAIGFGTVEIRAKRPYRVMSKYQYPELEENIIIESVEICAIKDPMPADGPCVFTGKAAVYFGNEAQFDDEKGHLLLQNMPLQVCDKTAGNLMKLGKEDIMVTPSTWFYDGGGCC